jgi:hypothetical protein
MDEAHLTWIFGCLLIADLLLAYPALTTAIALPRAGKRLGKLFGYAVTAFKREAAPLTASSWLRREHSFRNAQALL